MSSFTQNVLTQFLLTQAQTSLSGVIFVLVWFPSVVFVALFTAFVLHQLGSLSFSLVLCYIVPVVVFMLASRAHNITRSAIIPLYPVRFIHDVTHGKLSLLRVSLFLPCPLLFVPLQLFSCLRQEPITYKIARHSFLPSSLYSYYYSRQTVYLQAVFLSPFPSVVCVVAVVFTLASRDHNIQNRLSFVSIPFALSTVLREAK